jgi:hypothetical protein
MKNVRSGVAIALTLVAGCPGPSAENDAAIAPDAARRDADTAMHDGAVHDAGMADAFAADAWASDAGRDASADASASDALVTDAGRDAWALDATDAFVPVDADRDAGPELHPVVEEFLGSLATATCDLYDRCGLDLGFAMSFFDAADCQDLIGSLYADQIAPGYRALIDAGTASYDSVAAQACLDGLPSTTCDGAAAALSDCTAVFHGLVADGASCAADAECSPSSYCDDPVGCGNVGVCRPRAALGASCASDSGCARDAFCGAGVCTSYADVGDACSSTLRCRFGLECWSGTCGDPLSIAPADVGGACALDEGMRCASGLVCASDTSTCEPSGLALGASCHPATTDPCVASAYCGAGNVCQLRAAVGESCPGSVRCAFDSHCGAGSICVPISRVGGPCSSASDCRSDVCTAMICQPGRFCD